MHRVRLTNHIQIKDISSLFQSYCTNDVGPHFPERSHDPPTTVGSSLETRVSHTAQRSTQKNKTSRTNLVEISTKKNLVEISSSFDFHL